MRRFYVMLRRMRALLIIAILIAACKREMPPRDYQNNPPAMTHPVTSSAKSPSGQGMQGAAPEPNKGVEGKSNRKPVDPSQATTTLKDQAPTTTTR
jgi:PBP1b-binding outer membrane lipoprotein LpoB